MKNLLTGLIPLFVLTHAWALPDFDPIADATAGGGTAYTVGNPLAGNNQNVTNDWQIVNSGVVPANPQPVIVAGNLSYPDLAIASTGNSVSNNPPASGTGGTARLNLRAGAAPSIAYYSFILQITGVGAVPTSNANNFIAGFSDTTGSQAGSVARIGARLVTKQSGGGYVIGIGEGSTTADFAYDSVVRNVGDVVFVVASYERTGGGTNVNLWVNPPSASFGAVSPPPVSAGVTNKAATGDINANGIAAFILSCQNSTIPSCIIDEIRVTTNWGLVTGGTPTFPVVITSDPASRNVKVGDKVSFVVGSSGTSATYQWRFNDVGISGARPPATPLRARTQPMRAAIRSWLPIPSMPSRVIRRF